MAFNPNIPQNSDYMMVSQPEIQSNFQTIFSSFSENHVPLNSEAPLQGQHSQIVFREQTGDPTTSADQVALYTKASGSDTVIFYRPHSNATPIQLNYPNISTGLASTNPDVYKTTQYSFIAGAFVVYFGKITGATNGQVIALTPSTTLIQVGCTLSAAFVLVTSTMAIATNISGNQFTIKVDNTLPNPFDFYYVAIGKP